MALQLNQFNQSPIQGQMDLRFNPSVISCVVDSTSAGSLVPGQPVKQVTTTTGINSVPHIVECAADTDNVFGFINYNIKNQNFSAFDNVEIAAMENNVMYMTSNAAFVAGAKLMIVVSGVKVATATTGKTIIGTALDAATAANQIVRVVIALPGAASA